MTNSKPIIIPKDAVFYISVGNYSDYMIQGVFQALEDIDTECLLKEYLKERPFNKTAYGGTDFSEYEFMGWLYKKGLMRDIQCYEFRAESSYFASKNWVPYTTVDLIEGKTFSGD